MGAFVRSLPALAAALLLVALLAGCSDGSADAAADEPKGAALPLTTLAGTIEPVESFGTPTFRLVGALAQTGPVYGGGEPSAWAALDGTLFVAFPGCDRGFYLAEIPGQATCEHGPLYRSTDDGASWTRLNNEATGRYEDGGEAPAANGDAEVATDSAGAVYASNLGGGIQMHRSDDGGSTWTYIGNVVEEGEASDRQWIAAAGPGHLIVAWMGSGEDLDGEEQGRAVIVNSTLDGGATWTGSLALGSNIGWLGPVAFAPDGRTAYIPWTQVEQASTVPVGLLGTLEFSMRVGRTVDGGLTWDVLDTGARWTSSNTGGHWSGVHMAPALDVTGDGSIVVAYATDSDLQGLGLTAGGTDLWLMASHDAGESWSEPTQVDMTAPPSVSAGEGMRGSPIMPWVAGGAGDRFAVTYLYGGVATDTDYQPAVWDVRALFVDGFGTAEEAMADVLIEAGVHQGAVCSRGGACLATGSDRALLDFFESDVTPDGRLFVAYPADPLEGGKYIEIRVALQDGGGRLLARPAVPLD